MSARALPKPALRPYLPADAPVLADIFRSSIEQLTSDDYNAAQQDAWASAADDQAAFGGRLGKTLTLVATMDGSPVGFASLADNRLIDLLYVHPAVAGQGVGALLVDALERLAAGRGSDRVTVDASDSALGFFEKRGYQAQRRNTVMRGGEWFSNTTMEKRFDTGTSKP